MATIVIAAATAYTAAHDFHEFDTKEPFRRRAASQTARVPL
jgi:hypothetical protein